MSKYDRIVNNSEIFKALDNVKSKIFLDSNTNIPIYDIQRSDTDLESHATMLFDLTWVLFCHIYHNGREKFARVTTNRSKLLYDCNYFLWSDTNEIKSLLLTDKPNISDFEKRIEELRLKYRGLDCLDREYWGYCERNFGIKELETRDFDMNYNECIEILEEYESFI